MTPKPATKKKAMVQLVHIFYILLDIFSYTYKHFIFQNRIILFVIIFCPPSMLFVNLFMERDL